MNRPTSPSSTRPTRVRFAVLAALCALAAAVYMQRQCAAGAESTMRAELGLSKETMGWALGAWLWTYALFQIPAGLFGDRWGMRRALPLFCLVWSAATLLTGFMTWVPLLFALRLVFGVAHAGLFPCMAIIVRRWFPPEQRGQATGWIAAFQQVGAAATSVFAGWWLGLYLGLWTPEWAANQNVSIPPLPSWIEASSEPVRNGLRWLFDWRNLFVVVSLPGIVWSVWFLWWYRDRPADHPAMNAEELRLLPVEAAQTGTAHGDANIFAAMLRSRTMWLLCGQQFCRGFGYIFFQSWFPTYLQNARDVSIERSGWFTALMFVAALLGALLGGVLSDELLRRTGSRRVARQGLPIASLLVGAALAIGAYFVTSPTWAVWVLAGGSFFASLAGPAGYTVAIDVSGRHTASVFGTMNMAGNLGAAAFPPLVPYLLVLPEKLGLALSGWNLVLFVFGGIYVVAALFWTLLDPDGTIGERPVRTSDAASAVAEAPRRD